MGQALAKDVLVVVDPASTGAMLVLEANARKVPVVCVWSDACGEEMKTHTPPAAKDITFVAVLEEGGLAIEKLAALVKASAVTAAGSPATAVLAGSETGVRLADKLADALRLPGNGGDSSDKRRDKHSQQEAVRAAGARAIKQALCTSLEDVNAFLDTFGDAPVDVILKPTESAGSDGVARCRSRAEARAHFETLFGAINVCGAMNESVLAQEFISGTEYVVDHVSKGGKHHTACVWEYEKRVVNGATAPIVYFGQSVVDPSSELAQKLISYTRVCLDAIGLREGPSHGEVMMTADGPCLVEMNCRIHGNCGAWIPSATAALRATQVTLALDGALRGGQALKAAPDAPSGLERAAGMVMLVSYFEGVIAAAPGYAAIRALPSFAAEQLHLQPGDALIKSVDCCSIAGNVTLIHESQEQIAADYAAIRALEEAPGALWALEPNGAKHEDFKMLKVKGKSLSFRE